MLDVLHEDNHCLAVNKPAGLLSQGDDTRDPSVVDLASDYLRRKYAKPGNVYVGLLHRLDRPTSGVLLLARTSKAAARLSDQFRTGAVAKTYWAIVEGAPSSPTDTWDDWLLKDESRNNVAVVPPGTPGAQSARLTYQVLGVSPGRSWLEVRPATGRSHQIRVQLASRGLPIVGDKKYQARSTLRACDGLPRVALHSRSLGFTHPTTREAISVVAPVPADWPWSTPEGSPAAPIG